MTENQNNTPFAELPASLVQEILDRTDEISKTLLETFEHVKNQKSISQTLQWKVLKEIKLFLPNLSVCLKE